MSDIGNRMKNNYELPNRHTLLKRVPVIVRVDGKAFHSYTSWMKKPFDAFLIGAMDRAAEEVSKQIHSLVYYVQSDEVSFLLTDYSDFNTEPYFGYVKSKLESVIASMMTAYFNDVIFRYYGNKINKPAFFDARAFNVPKEEVTNYFLWRMKDWYRNSIQLVAQSVASQRELNGLNAKQQQDLIVERGLNWKDFSPRERNGLLCKGGFFYRRKFGYNDLNDLLEEVIQNGKI